MSLADKLSPDDLFVLKAVILGCATASAAVAHQLILRYFPLTREEWRAYQKKHRYYKWRNSPFYPMMNIFTKNRDPQ